MFDTNVLLSMFVFPDSRFAPLRERLIAGQYIALSDERCLTEFRRVLQYPMFALDDGAQTAAFERYRQLVESVAANPTPAYALPRCSDSDDQKFLEVARDGQADWLLTSDKALLKLARRQKLSGKFQILTPDRALAVSMDSYLADNEHQRTDLGASE